jgi:hypothetical protein
MNKDLPFVIPENDLDLNLLLVYTVVYYLNKTSTGKLVLDIERLNIYVYLVKNPHILYKVLVKLSKKSFVLKSYEILSFKADNNDSETLYNNKILKFYIQILMTNNQIKTEYNEKIGFVFYPSDEANNYMNFENKYFERVLNFIEKLKQINSTPLSQINTTIKNILEGK